MLVRGSDPFRHFKYKSGKASEILNLAVFVFYCLVV